MSGPVALHGGAEFQPGDDFVVFYDPVGHPFCLCLGAPASEDIRL